MAGLCEGGNEPPGSLKARQGGWLELLVMADIAAWESHRITAFENVDNREFYINGREVIERWAFQWMMTAVLVCFELSSGQIDFAQYAYGLEFMLRKLDEQYRRMQRIRNQEIRRRLEAEETVLGRIDNKPLSWIRHLLKMGEESDSLDTSLQTKTWYKKIVVEGKSRKKPQPGNLPRPGIKPGPPGFAARRANRYSTGVDENKRKTRKIDKNNIGRRRERDKEKGYSCKESKGKSLQGERGKMALHFYVAVNSQVISTLLLVRKIERVGSRTHGTGLLNIDRNKQIPRQLVLAERTRRFLLCTYVTFQFVYIIQGASGDFLVDR
ncbi:hypothetical protein ANN_14071 [Periplaneta americana]|uniref:Uncharacterized protein n=1 Tax=Periplaneta americana TaxID=6978 RepID=A0ABQ8SVC4_PERAM|nr:hypothetical protein ANN_14071 [Periplaneta americana]